MEVMEVAGERRRGSEASHPSEQLWGAAGSTGMERELLGAKREQPGASQQAGDAQTRI